jgi:hypothetical protein
MSIDTPTLIWLFPVAFMLHDFEELILFEPWLKKNAPLLRKIFTSRLPAFLAEPMSAILEKTSGEFALPVSLIFCLTCLASFLAVVYKQYTFLLLASSLFSLHGFMHLGQSIVLRRYVPSLITSILVVIPYGLILFPRLISEGVVDPPGLAFSALLSVLLTVPFILIMHKAGDYLYRQTIRLLIK